MSHPQDDIDSSLPKKTGMSTTTKVVLVMLTVGGGMLLLCCGGAIAFTWYAARQVQNSMTTNPVQVQEMTEQIVSIDIPESYEPKTSMTMEMFGMKMSNYARKDDPRGVLIVMQNRAGFNANDEQSRKRMLDQMRMQMGMQGGAATNSETREVDIDGEKVPFQFNTLDQNGQKMKQVMGLVPLKSGAVLIMIMLPEELYDEDEIVAMLESIREPQPKTDQLPELPVPTEVPNPDGAEVSHGEGGTEPVEPKPEIKPTPESTPPAEAEPTPGEKPTDDGNAGVEAERPEPVATPE